MRRTVLGVLIGLALVPLLLGAWLALVCPMDGANGTDAESRCDHCLACSQSHDQLVPTLGAALVALEISGLPHATSATAPTDPFSPGIDHPPLLADC